MTVTQGDMFNQPQRQHTYLPSRPTDTQVAAALAVSPKTPTQRQRVLDLIRDRGVGGLTDEEIGYALSLSQNSVRPRRLELVEAGLVEDSGRRRATVGGNPAIVWVAVR